MGATCAFDTPWETRRTRTDLFVGRSKPTFGQGLRELADTLVAFITLACIPLAVRRLLAVIRLLSQPSPVAAEFALLAGSATAASSWNPTSSSRHHDLVDRFSGAVLIFDTVLHIWRKDRR